MVGDADRTVSPSSSSTSRSTPWVLGCCGPMLTVIVSVRISGIDLSIFTGGSGSAPGQTILEQARPKFFFGDLHGFGRVRLHLDLDRIVLAQRIPLPVLGHQQAPRI